MNQVLKSFIRLILLSPVILTFYIQKATSQELSIRSYNDLKFGNISKNNTSITRIQDIIQDNKGFVWIGTMTGLYRYDGLNFKYYKSTPEDKTSLLYNDVRQLMIDKQGTLWIASFQNLSKYIPHLDAFENIISEKEFSANNQHPLEIEESKDGTIWIATTAGLNYYVDGTMKRFDKLPNERIWSLTIDPEQRIWAITEDEVYIIYKDKSVAILSTLTDLELQEADYLLASKSGAIWVGTINSGLYQIEELKNGSWAVTQYKHSINNPRSISSGKISVLCEDHLGQLWVGIENGGLNLFRPETSDFLHWHDDPNKDASLSGNSIWELYEDRQGRLWVGTYNQGIDVYDPLREKFNHISQKSSNHSISSNSVTSFLFLEDNIVWIGTDGGGINIWDRNEQTFEYLQSDPNDSRSLGSNAVIGMYEDSFGEIWISTWAGGLNLYLPEKVGFKKFVNDPKDPKSISSNSIFNILEDSKRRLWISAFDGGVDLFNRDTEEFSHITMNSGAGRSLNGKEVIALLEDDQQNIWVGTQQGLNRINFNSMEDYSVTSFSMTDAQITPLPSNFITDLYLDTKSRMWSSTLNGLCLYLNDKEGFKVFDERHGLPSSQVKSVFQDQEGNFWVTSSNGLSYMTESPGGHFEIQNFDIYDGLQSNNFNMYASAVTNEGEIFLGGVNGFNYFTLDEVKANTQLANVVFTNLRIFNKSVDFRKSPVLNQSINTAKTLTFDHTQNVFTLEYIVLSFTGAYKNQYAYRLEGFEEEWNEVGTQKSASYTNLDAGIYQFQVKASNNDGVWNDHPTEMTIIVLPPWWKTIWAKALMIGLVLILFITIYKLRTAAHVRQKIILQDRVEEQTSVLSTKNEQLSLLNNEKDGILSIVAHDLRSPFNNIKGLIQLLEITSELNQEQKNYFHKINLSIDRGHQLINDLLDISNFQNDRSKLMIEPILIGELFDELSESADEKVIAKNQRLDFHAKSSARLKTDKLLLWRILENLLSNAIKYSPEGKSIHISSKEENERTIFVIKDEGPGFSEDDKKKMFGKFQKLSARPTGNENSTGLGLSIVKMIVEKLMGSIQVESEQGKGSTFIVSLPNLDQS